MPITSRRDILEGLVAYAVFLGCEEAAGMEISRVQQLCRGHQSETSFLSCEDTALVSRGGQDAESHPSDSWKDGFYKETETKAARKITNWNDMSIPTWTEWEMSEVETMICSVNAPKRFWILKTVPRVPMPRRR